MPGSSLKARGRLSPVFGPSKFEDRRKIVLQIVAGVYLEPSRIQTTGSKRVKEGLNRCDKEVLLIMAFTVNFFECYGIGISKF